MSGTSSAKSPGAELEKTNITSKEGSQPSPQVAQKNIWKAHGKPPSRKFSAPNHFTPHPKNAGYKRRQGYKDTAQPRYSFHYKNNVSFSPLQAHPHKVEFRKFNSDYRVQDGFGYSDDHSQRASLPNDSWHYQIQMQQTVKQGDLANSSKELDLPTFKTVKCTIEAKHNP